ncbi:MAG: serine/threonine protein kinase, partial [Deltaproteobacteria bacterium]|nr:serine/threonine protein kinase [Deltaproteobacteria bacterium]
MLLTTMDTPPKSIDRFQIVRELGRGGMGIVYEATDGHSGESIALKVLRDTNPQNLLLLKNEFRALADLQHPNLVALHELHADGQGAFLTMELLGGQHLLHALRGHEQGTGVAWLNGATRTLGLSPDDTLPRGGVVATGPPPPPATPLAESQVDALRDRFGQVAEGIAALHAASRLHRDVKPSNVLVSDTGRAVLLDFGLVAELQGDLVTLEDGIAGSVPYMAPEQVRGGELTPAADWYAFGAMLYEALVGHPPFTGPLADVFRAKQTASPTPPSELIAHVPADLEALCLALLHRTPSLRPKDEDVLAALGRDAAAARAVHADGVDFVEIG